MKTKICNDCKLLKELDDFGIRHIRDRTYTNSFCRACMIRRSNIWQRENKKRFDKRNH